MYIDIFKEVKKDFSDLWECRERGETLEILTPYSTTTHKHVSIFLTKQGDSFIISDGGWISENAYSVENEHENKYTSSAVEYFKDYFRMKVLNAGNREIFYKKCDSMNLISAMVFDVSSFVSQVISVKSVKELEYEHEHRFGSRVNRFLYEKYDKKEVLFNSSLDDVKNVTYSAIIRKPSEIYLLIYITGFNYTYFSRSIKNAAMNFEMALDSKNQDYIKGKIPVIDNDAPGCNLDKAGNLLSHLNKKTNIEPIRWENRNDITELIKSSK